MTSNKGTKDIIAQIQVLLGQIDDEQYTQSLSLFNGGTLGQHFRHILDFYNCLIKGAAAGEVDYSKRARNPQIEQEVKLAVQSFQMILNRIENLKDDQPVNIITDFSKVEGGERSMVKSSVGRELMYAYDHAIHHLAIIKMGIQTTFPNVPMSASLGVAPSTVKHRLKV